MVLLSDLDLELMILTMGRSPKVCPDCTSAPSSGVTAIFGGCQEGVEMPHTPQRTARPRTTFVLLLYVAGLRSRASVKNPAIQVDPIVVRDQIPLHQLRQQAQ